MFYYADRETQIYVTASQNKIDDSAFVEVPFPPETGFSRWDGREKQWVDLTAVEIDDWTEGDEREEDDISDIVTPAQTLNSTLAVWGGTQGQNLTDSEIEVRDRSNLSIPGIIDFITRALIPIYINGKPLTLSNFLDSIPKEDEAIVYQGDGKWKTKKIEAGQGASKYGWSWLTSINSSGVTTSSQRRQNGTPTVYNPFTVPRDCYLIEVTVENRPTDTKEFAYVIYVNNKEQARFTKPKGKTHEVFDDLKIEFKKGDRVFVYSISANNNERISHPGGAMYFIEQ